MVSGANQNPREPNQTKGAIRLVRLVVPPERAGATNIQQTIGTLTRRFLESTVRMPFVFHIVDATAFLISGAVGEHEVEDYTISLQMRLREFLFGTDETRNNELQVLSFAGSMSEIQSFLDADPDAAKTMSEAFRWRNESRNRAEPEKSSSWRYNWHTETREDDTRFRFRGILEAKNRVLIAHALTAKDMYGQPGFDDVHLGKFLAVRSPNTIDFEITAFKHALNRVSRAIEMGLPMVLFVPVTYRTLIAKEARDLYLNELRRAPGWMKDHVGMMVFCSPNSPSFDAIQRCAMDFATHFRFIDWQVTSNDFQCDRFMNSGLHSVTLDIHHIIDERLSQIEQFGQKVSDLNRMKIKAAITGIKTRDELLLAIRNGVSFLSGPLITTALQNPLPPRQISPGDLPLSDLEENVAA